MNIWLGNPGLLLGLLGLGIPLLIHLLHRRRHEIVDWGAMQFLEVAPRQRRRWWWEEFLLLAVRLGLVALLVLALATPRGSGSFLRPLAEVDEREIVLVVDASTSMHRRLADGTTPWDKARARVERILDEGNPGDRFGIVLAGQVPSGPTMGSLRQAGDLKGILPEASRISGFPDWPRAVEAAVAELSDGDRNKRLVLLLHDGQKNGWADPGTIARWERLAPETLARCRLRYEDIVKEDDGPTNFALTPLRTAAPMAWPGQKIRFTSEIVWGGRPPGTMPRKLSVLVDGKIQENLPLPKEFPGSSGRRAIDFRVGFREAGTHVVTLALENDAPAEKNAGGSQSDRLPQDNRRHVVVEVVQDLPVLLVDGAKAPDKGGAALFLNRALAPEKDGKGATAPVLWPSARLQPADLWEDEKATRPRWRTIVLADGAAPTPEMADALDRYVRAGGGLLLFLGPRAAEELPVWNERAYRGGTGWLPAELVAVAGKEDDPEGAAFPDPASIDHPALDRFADPTSHALQRVRFPRWFRVRPDSKGIVMARMVGGTPFLVEKTLGQGRVILCTVPPDRSWKSDFPIQGDFPVLLHELLRYLSGFAANPTTLAPGAVYRYSPPVGAGRSALLPARGSMKLPDGSERSVFAEAWPWTTNETRIPGHYRLTWDQGGGADFIVETDPKESDLALADDGDRDRVAGLLGIGKEATSSLAGPAPEVDLWWLFFVGLIGFLCLEIGLTRKVTAGRGGLEEGR